MHVYALVHSSAVDLTLPEGVSGPLETIKHQQLMAVIEPNLQLEDLQQNDAMLLQAVLAHDRVIRELFLQTTVLPLRFNAFPTLTHLKADLETNQARYLAILEQLAGQIELTLKLIPVEMPEPQIAPELKGKEYFLAKKQVYQAQQQQRDAQAQEFNLVMQAIAQFYPIVIQSDSQQAYLLIHQEKVVALQQQLSNLEKKITSWELSLGEALPPFHFVEGDGQ